MLPMSNDAFIDGLNLHAGIKQLGWTLDYHKYHKFRGYLTDHCRVRRAYYFIGHVPTQEPLYARLRRAGYDLRFKPVVSSPKHAPTLIRYLVQEDRLAAVLSPNRAFCSALVKRESKGRLWFVEDRRATLSTERGQENGGRLPRERDHPPSLLIQRFYRGTTSLSTPWGRLPGDWASSRCG